MIEKLVSDSMLATLLMRSISARAICSDFIVAEANEAIILRLKQEATIRLKKAGYNPIRYTKPPINPYKGIDGYWGQYPFQ